MKWCIRQLWCSSTILYNITIITYNHHTDIYPLLNIHIYTHIYTYLYTQVIAVLLGLASFVALAACYAHRADARDSKVRPMELAMKKLAENGSSDVVVAGPDGQYAQNDNDGNVGYGKNAKKAKNGTIMKRIGHLSKSHDSDHAQMVQQYMQGVTGGLGAQTKQHREMTVELQLINRSLPSVLSDQPLGTRVQKELKSFHRWFCIVFHYNKSFPRLLRVVVLSTNVISTLFMQAILYNITNPDTGKCKTYNNFEDCIEEPSGFQGGESMCYWVPGNVKGLCHFREPADSLVVVTFVAVFAAIVSIPVVVLVENLVKKILSSRTLPAELTASMRLKARDRRDSINSSATTTKTPNSASESALTLTSTRGRTSSTINTADTVYVEPGEKVRRKAEQDALNRLQALNIGGVSGSGGTSGSGIGSGGRRIKGVSIPKRRGGATNLLGITNNATAGGGGVDIDNKPINPTQARRSSLAAFLGFSINRSSLSTTLQQDLGSLVERLRKYVNM